MSRHFRAISVVCAMLVLALVPAALTGQSTTTPAPTSGTTILGSVVDAALTPVPGASVMLEREGHGLVKTTTANDGTFRFANIAAGTYRIRVEHSGFPAFTRELRVPSGVDTVRMPIVLAKPGDKLEEARPADSANRQANQAPTAAPVPMPTAPPPPGTAGGVVGGVGVGQGQGGGAGGGRGGSAATAYRGQADMAEQQYSARGRDRSDLYDPWSGYRYRHSGERYAHVEPNTFQSAWKQPLSTFGADVDTASYTNVRRFLSSGQLPPRDAVRVEEFVNYFKFGYGGPTDGHPLALTTEIGDCPWAPSHKLVLIGARAKAVTPREITGRNIVLLLDVSGSMAPADRLPLLQSALHMFVETLQPADRLAIVTYAGTSGVALPSTPLNRRDVIQRAIAGLSAGGSTNGGSGLITAYRVARDAYMPGGVNRVILATDGDFNVGITNRGDLLRLIERERESGVFLSVLGVGTGNLNDATMELLADKGNGHYAYLDSLQEARRVLIREADATIENVAKDVKFQVEFNPAVVSAWKLIGYENRLLAAQDFNDDRKDGGDMGAGHTVTVLYEIVPAGVENPDNRGDARPDVDPLRYQAEPPRPTQPRPVQSDAAVAGEWLTVKARYKQPEGETSQLIVRPVQGSAVRARHLPLASAVAEFGLLLRSGAGNTERWDALAERVRRLSGPPSQTVEFGGFIELVEIARGLSRGTRR